MDFKKHLSVTFYQRSIPAMDVKEEKRRQEAITDIIQALTACPRELKERMIIIVVNSYIHLSSDHNGRDRKSISIRKSD